MLSLLSSIYAKIIDARNARYDSGRSASFDLGARTISVGNITAGGTGKTPLVIMIAEKLAARGERVCVLTRGYGRRDPGKRVLVSDGENVLADSREAGDEPVEMARALSGKAIVIADKDRVAAGRWSRERFGVTAFILDDGFQHRRARRDVDIVCVDALDPFGGEKTLPAGRLREPLNGLKRATAVVITRSDLVDNLEDIKAEIRRFNNECPIFTARTVTSRITALDEFLGSEVREAAHGPENNDFESLVKTPAFAFCALGNPEAFFGTLRRDNFDLVGTHAFRDHFVYRQPDVAALTKKARDVGADYLLTTAKDAVKLNGLQFEIPCYVLESSIAIDEDAQFSALF